MLLRFEVAEMIKRTLILLFLLIALSCGAPAEEAADIKKPVAGSTTYDQRQTGKYNVHVNIKDVQFFSLSDSIGGIGGDYEGDYGDYDFLEGPHDGNDNDYDSSHLTVNPIFAFLGSKPTTAKPTTLKPEATTEKAPQTSSTTTTEAAPTTTEKAAATSSASKPESESEAKPASNEKKPETIDYEEIPVEVQYYRTNQQKLSSNGRQTANRFHKRRPSVQIIDGHGRASNVKIVDHEQTREVKICNRGEYRDNLGRCRVRQRGVPGLRRLINMFSAFTSRKN